MTDPNVTLQCGIPFQPKDQILMAHGGGGKLMHQLIESVFKPAFGESGQELSCTAEHDSIVLPHLPGKLAFTTDSFVVNPLVFPGGDIGKLAIYGTVNDLAMSGAKPKYLSAGFILEEGCSIELLKSVVQSMRLAAEECGIQIVTGDTKVVQRGKGDQIFINTSGIGVIEHGQAIHPRSVQAGDWILISGDLGRHGIAIMAEREGLQFETTIQSDCASLSGIVQSLLTAGIEIHCLRDLTRGGLVSALNEVMMLTKLSCAIDEKLIPVLNEVRGACEMLGLDPLYVANEGRMVAFIPEASAQHALKILQAHSVSENAAIIGRVESGKSGRVFLRSVIGTSRLLDMVSGEQLPRIC